MTAPSDRFHYYESCRPLGRVRILDAKSRTPMDSQAPLFFFFSIRFSFTNNPFGHGPQNQASPVSYKIVPGAPSSTIKQINSDSSIPRTLFPTATSHWLWVPLRHFLMAHNDDNQLDREILASEQDDRPYDHRDSHEVERVLSASSASTSSSNASLRERSSGMSRVPTQRDLERHPTELDRIQTARSQHSATVGVSMGRSNTRTRDSRRPMPAMGAGKEIPPNLDADAYVVEFDGPDDPWHAQNWPLTKKYVLAIHRIRLFSQC